MPNFIINSCCLNPVPEAEPVDGQLIDLDDLVEEGLKQAGAPKPYFGEGVYVGFSYLQTL